MKTYLSILLLVLSFQAQAKDWQKELEKIRFDFTETDSALIDSILWQKEADYTIRIEKDLSVGISDSYTISLLKAGHLVFKFDGNKDTNLSIHDNILILGESIAAGVQGRTTRMINLESGDTLWMASHSFGSKSYRTYAYDDSIWVIGSNGFIEVLDPQDGLQLAYKEFNLDKTDANQSSHTTPASAPR